MSDLVERLPNVCKMRGHSVYASDIDCKACGLGEGEACDAYIRASAIGFTSQPRPNILDNVTAGAWAVGSENAALKAEIERLTAEREAALAKVAQYEQAPVVGWGVLIGSWVEFATSRRAADEIAEPYDNVTVVALTTRPEVTK